uniref:Uncharacterized protein n=1 Tax=Anguilla anguilla TaxID=7936 RepID=A0A0E9T790_ANGAN
MLSVAFICISPFKNSEVVGCGFSGLFYKI